MPKPSVREVADITYDETDTCLKIHTENGLRGKVFYNIANHPEYTIYANGDSTYALSAFVVYIYNKTGDFPLIERVGSPSKELTYNR